MLTLKSFVEVELSQGRYYMSHRTKDRKEICLENCLNGFCVALYDEFENLIGEKVCTDFAFPGIDFGIPVIEKALELANYKLECLSTIK